MGFSVLLLLILLVLARFLLSQKGNFCIYNIVALKVDLDKATLIYGLPCKQCKRRIIQCLLERLNDYKALLGLTQAPGLAESHDSTTIVKLLFFTRFARCLKLKLFTLLSWAGGSYIAKAYSRKSGTSKFSLRLIHMARSYMNFFNRVQKIQLQIFWFCIFKANMVDII